jgi:TIR domain
MDSILKLVPYGENVVGEVVATSQVIRILERLEESLERESLHWSDVSLLILVDSKRADWDKHQFDTAESIKRGIEQFSGERSWYPSLIGASVFTSFFRFHDQSDPEIHDGLLFVACASAVLPKIPVAYEITQHRNDRRFAGARALGEAMEAFRRKTQETLGVEIPSLAVAESSAGLIFTTGSGHIELERDAGRMDRDPQGTAVRPKQFVDFKDCYAVGQELLRAARESSAQLFGGCATNRTPNQLQCLYYSEEIGARTHYRSTYRHGAVVAFLPYARAQPHLRHPYRHTKVAKLDIEFHERDKYADGRYFYVRKINGRPPIEFLADYWDYSVEQLEQMADDGIPIPSKPGAHLVTIASSLNRYDENAWPNVPIWLDREGDEILLRLVRAEADDGNYYLMELKPEYLADNARDLMSAVRASFSGDASVVSFLCESRKYVLNDIKSNAEAETMLAEAPAFGALIGIYLNGEYSTGAPASIGYHNYSQIGAIIWRRPLTSLPTDISEARRASSLKIFLCHASRDKSTVREFADVLEQELPGAAQLLDEDQLLVGDLLEREIEATIRGNANFFVPFLSDRSVDSEWVQKELRWAVETEIERERTFVLPVILDDRAGVVMDALSATWDAALVAHLEARLQLHVHDFTRDEITQKAKLLASHIRRRISERDAKGEAEFHHGLRPVT